MVGYHAESPTGGLRSCAHNGLRLVGDPAMRVLFLFWYRLQERGKDGWPIVRDASVQVFFCLANLPGHVNLQRFDHESNVLRQVVDQDSREFGTFFGPWKEAEYKDRSENRCCWLAEVGIPSLLIEEAKSFTKAVAGNGV